MSLWDRWKAKREALFDKLEKDAGKKFSRLERDKVDRKLSDILSYQPRIGFLGKTGTGKSSLCNALFGANQCKISDVEACTRDVQELFLKVENDKGLKLVDVPGVGEKGDRDTEYAELYEKLLPELDAVLWLVKGDDRALSVDEAFFKKIVRPHIEQGKPFFFVLNQVDKIEPCREWDEKNSTPGPKQGKNINLKIDYVRSIFEVSRHQVLAVSANEQYGLVELVDAIVEGLPKEKKITFAEKVDPSAVSDKTRESARLSFMEVIADAIAEKWNDLVDIGHDIVDKVSDAWNSLTDGCFITTAVCESKNKPDDCYELTQFRKFRDEWLLLQTDGKNVIHRYYEIAPHLLEIINKRSDSKEILDSINANYLVPCLKLIEEHRYAECKKIYVTMIEKLEHDLNCNHQTQRRNINV